MDEIVARTFREDYLSPVRRYKQPNLATAAADNVRFAIPRKITGDSRVRVQPLMNNVLPPEFVGLYRQHAQHNHRVAEQGECESHKHVRSMLVHPGKAG